ncbi:hypothetical protein [Altererythrobacter aquiaggeris]|uniref:hypothetical protein n=1 Tax=Aestuarierythrobacter aquiaggeris TaxID=1898396 RepID=UPI00301AE9D6
MSREENPPDDGLTSEDGGGTGAGAPVGAGGGGGGGGRIAISVPDIATSVVVIRSVISVGWLSLQETSVMLPAITKKLIFLMKVFSG